MGRVTSVMPHLSEEEVFQRLRLTISSAEHRRWLVIWNALIDPRPAKEIAKHTGFRTNTIHDLVSKYNRFGPQSIESSKESKRRRCYLSKEQEIIFLTPFLERAKKGQIATAAEIRSSLEELLKHSVHHSMVYRLLKRHGWRKIVPRPFHIKSDEKIQEDFKKEKFPELVAEILAQRDPQDIKPVIIMSQDEGRFGRISSHRASWAPPGIRPKAPRQIVRVFAYVFAAICMALGKMTALILPEVNTEAMNIFLKEVSEDFSKYFIIMLVDGAGWHTAKDLQIPENIRLIKQPPYSPELNPVEHLWDELREKYLHNTGFKSLDELQDALCYGICELADSPERLRSLTNFPYLRL